MKLFVYVSFLTLIITINGDTRPLKTEAEVPTLTLGEGIIPDEVHDEKIPHFHPGRKERCFFSSSSTKSSSGGASSATNWDIIPRIHTDPSGPSPFLFGSYSRPMPPIGMYPFENQGYYAQ